MSAKAKPAHRMRDRALAAMIGKNGSDKAGLYSVISGRSHEQGNHRRQTARFECSGLVPSDQALTCMVTAGSAERGEA